MCPRLLQPTSFRFPKPALIAGLVCAMIATTRPASAGFTVRGTQLIDGNGQPFVIRGISHMHTWYRTRTHAFADIAATGANTVRVVLATGAQWPRNSGADVANVIQLCRSAKLVCMLEVHDSTGWPEAGAAAPIANAVDYWTSADVLAAIQGQEDYVLINIANEPFGNTVTKDTYVNDTIAAVTALRAAGLQHTLVVDAANWGQDWQFFMRDSATTIFGSDPLENLLFSVHMYEVFHDRATVASYMQAFDDANLALIVGEFGADHRGQQVDEDSIMAEAQARSIGYLGWAWSGNGGCCTSLDVVIGFDPTRLSPWGQRLINGSNGIADTSVCASVYTDCGGGGGDGGGGGGGDGGGGGPGTVTCSAGSVNGWGDGFVLSSYTVTNTGDTDTAGWRVTLQFNQSVTISNAWGISLSSSAGTELEGTGVSYNSVLPPGASVTFGMQGASSGDIGTPGCTAH